MVAEYFARDRVDQISGNPVIGKGFAHPCAIDIPASERIVNRDSASLAVHQFAEVSIQELRRGYRCGERPRRTFPIALVVHHEEAPVTSIVELRQDDRTANLKAILIEIVLVTRSSS